jgi:hypothetical protein
MFLPGVQGLLYILLNKCFSLHSVSVVVCQPLMLCMYTNVMWAWKQGEMPKSWHGFTRVPTLFDSRDLSHDVIFANK